uniref:Rootletin-like coiled-coil domain-containing protein n=2 Tax=Timema TaxID=61471 RepID=A0A7R9I054_9NEOP|nr:unnamed protein product [Timema bartmani]
MTRQEETPEEGKFLTHEYMDRRRPPFVRATPRTRPEMEPGGLEEPSAPEMLVRQNQDLRRRLEDEAANYKRRLETYRTAQQHQAALVSRLQAKVLQYKQRCSELEVQVLDPSGPTSTPSTMAIPLSAPSSSLDLDTAMRRLEDEHRKCEKLSQLNSAMREQLEESHATNEALTSDLQKLTNEWEQLREEMIMKEDEWREEERAFNDYYTMEHNRLLNVWRDVVSVKRGFAEMKASTERDMTRLQAEVSSVSCDITSSCSGLVGSLKQSSRSGEKQQFQYEQESLQLKAQVSALRLEHDTASKESREKDERIQHLLADIHNLVSPSKTKAHLFGHRQVKNRHSTLRGFCCAPFGNLTPSTLGFASVTARCDDRTNCSNLSGEGLKLPKGAQQNPRKEERCGEAEHGVGQVVRLQEEVELLQNALRDIAHAVIQDAENRDSDATHTSPHIHLTPSGPVPQRSPKRGQRTPTSPAFAESTISGVQAALHKYQLYIHDLQVKLQANKEQLLLVRKQCESSDESQHTLEVRLAELTVQLDTCRSQCAQLTSDKDSLHKSLESARTEKKALDRNRLEMTAIIDALNADYEKLQKANSRLQKLCDSSEDEKIFLQSELDRVAKDADLRESNLRAEEERCSRLREELLTLREEMNRAYLSRDMLEQHKLETDSLINQLEKSKGDVDLELERLVLEKSDLQESLGKMEAVCMSLEKDKKRLQADIAKLGEEKSNLQSQCADQHNDLASLRKEILQAEQSRLDLESDKVSLLEKVKFLEIEKEKVELELGQVSRERGDLSNQLSVLARSKDALNEELMRLRQRLEQAGETNARLNRDLEDLVKEKEEKQIMLESSDKELQRVQEQLASLRSEKEALEGVLFDTQTNLEATETRRSQLDTLSQELLVKQEAFKGQVARLSKELEVSERRCRDIKESLTRQSGSQEAEFTQTLTNMKKQHEDTSRKLMEEKEQIRLSLEKRLQQTVSQLTSEKDQEIMNLQERVDILQQHIDSICQQHEEVLLRAENDKQQSLLLAQRDQQALQEKLDSTRRELEEWKGGLERLKRESSARAEQDRCASNQLRDEFARLKTRLDECRTKCEEERVRLEGRVSEVRKEREILQQECEELRVQLHLSEDKIDSLTTQLHDTSRRLKEVDTSCEGMRKELTDIRRQLTDTSYEKEKYQSSNKELREHIKRIEGDKREQGRSLEEALQKIASLEDVRSSLEAERVRLQGLLRELERKELTTTHQLQSLQEELQRSHAANSAIQGEEKELQARLATETEERERAQQESHQLRKQIVELDGTLDMARQEMTRMRARAEEGEERWRAREQELLVRLEDSRGRERKLEDQRHNLEVCLADATQQLQELKARLGGSEGRVRALDGQLQQLEAAKKEVEQKLSSIGSTLRRIAGIQMDGSVNLPFRLMSPSRRWITQQDHGDGRHDGCILVDVDPEVVRKGVRNLMQQVAQIERERDHVKDSQVVDMKGPTGRHMSRWIQQLGVGQVTDKFTVGIGVASAWCRVIVSIAIVVVREVRRTSAKSCSEWSRAGEIMMRKGSAKRRWSKAEEVKGNEEFGEESRHELVDYLVQDDLKTHVTGMKRQLQESHDIHSQVDAKLNVALQNLRAAQDEKSSMETQLSNKQATLQAQSEALQQKSEEVQLLREKMTSLELLVHSGAEEKGQSEERIEKLRQAVGKLEGEKRGLQEELGRTEARATKLELQRMSLEGDLQRLQMLLQEKDAHVQKLQERCEVQSRTVSSLEERCASLKTTVEQLKTALERAAMGEADLRADIQSLQRTLADTSATSQASSEKLKQLQKSLSNSENERRVVSERLDAAQSTLAELRRSNQQLSEQVHRLQTELSNNEVQRSGLEAQLRLASWPNEGEIHPGREQEIAQQLSTVQRERAELKARVESLADKVRQLEAEKRSMERNVAAGHSKSSYELRPEKSSGDRESAALLEQENRELKLRIRRLESQLAEKEAELTRLRAERGSGVGGGGEGRGAETERLRAAQLQAERLLEAREQSHRQQVLRLENQLQLLREQLNQEVKRRQLYVLRSSRAGREMQQLRQALGDSLRTVAQDPSLDAMLLEHETRKLDTSLTSAQTPK